MNTEEKKKYQELVMFVARENQMRNLINLKPLDFETSKNLMVIMDKLNYSLEPDMLTMDGELSEQEVNEKRQALVKCVNQMLEFKPSIKNQLSNHSIEAIEIVRHSEHTNNHHLTEPQAKENRPSYMMPGM